MANITLNGAGSSAADPILKGLGVDVVYWTSSMDVATVNDVGIDPTTGATISNSVKSSLSPVSTTITAAANGSYTNATSRYTISSTTGLAAGDYIYLSHASLTDGIYEIATVFDGTNITLVNNPLVADQSSIGYQVVWVYQTDTATSPFLSDGAGDQNFIKADMEDSGTNATDFEADTYVRDAPTGSSYITLEGGDYTGQTAGDLSLTLAILSGWTNNGGITHIEMANHSVQTVNNFTWTTGGGTGEKTIADAEGGLTAAAGDGMKYGRLEFKSAASAGTVVGVDIDINVDSSGPTLGITLLGA